MKNKIIVLSILSLYFLNIGFAQYGAINKTFSDYGVEDPRTLKDLEIAKLILVEPYLFDSEKERFFEGMKTMDREQVQGFPALIVKFRLGHFLGVSWDTTSTGIFNRIRKVRVNSTAAKAGLAVGDIIKSLNDCKINVRKDITYCFNQVSTGEEVNIGIERNNKFQIVKARFQNRIGTYQAWEESLFLDIMMGNLSLKDFEPKQENIPPSKLSFSTRTPTGKTYADLMVAKSTIYKDTILAKEILEDTLLTDYHKKVLFNELKDFVKKKSYLIQNATTPKQIVLTRRMFIKGLMLQEKFEPNLGIRLQFEPNKKLAKIVDLEKGSCMEEAGIKVGDYLKFFDGKALVSDIEVFGTVIDYTIGDSIEVEIERSGRPITTTVRLKNYLGNYFNWSPELNKAVVDNNFALEDYEYLKDKKYFRDTSLWGCPIKLITVKSTITLVMGYFPALSYSIEVLFEKEQDRERFHELAKTNSITVAFLTKRDKLVFGSPKDPLYIKLPPASFKEGETIAAFQHQCKLDSLLQKATNNQFINAMNTSWYFQTGFEFFGVQLMENDAPINSKQLMETYRENGADKYYFKKEQLNGSDKKKKN